MSGALVFHPGEMDNLAGELGGIGDKAQLAWMGLGRVDTGGLPPELAGSVEGELNSLRSVLWAAGGSLDGAGRYVSDVVGKVRRSEQDPGSPFWRKAGSDALKVLPGQLADWAAGMPLDTRRKLGLGGLVVSLTGVKELESIIMWSEWRAAVAASGVDAAASKREKARAAMRRRADPARPPIKGNGPLKQVGRWVERRIPLFGLGAAGLEHGRLVDKVHADEPQTGIAQAAIDVRDVTALYANTAHIASNSPAAPVFKPIGLAADFAVLTMDTGYQASKLVKEQTVDKVVDLGKGLTQGRFRFP